MLSLTLLCEAVQQTKVAETNICSAINLYSLRSSRISGSYDSKRIIMTFSSCRQTSQFLLHFSHYSFPLYSPLSSLVLSKPYLVFVCTVYNAVKALGVCVCFLVCFVPATQSLAWLVPMCTVSQLELPLKTEAPWEIKAFVCVCAMLISLSPDGKTAVSGILTVGCGDSFPALSTLPSSFLCNRIYPIMFAQRLPYASSPPTLSDAIPDWGKREAISPELNCCQSCASPIYNWCNPQVTEIKFSTLGPSKLSRWFLICRLSQFIVGIIQEWEKMIRIPIKTEKSMFSNVHVQVQEGI